MPHKIIHPPIMLSKDCVVVLRLFTREHNGDDFSIDLWMSDSYDHMAESVDQHKLAAKEFIDQLSGQQCMAFMLALRDEADFQIKEWEDMKASYAKS